MVEYTWELPGTPARKVTLQIRSRRGWFGRKVLTINGKSVFRRGRFAGIYARFPDADGGRWLELRTVQIKGSPVWRPALFRDGQEVPEITNTAPPRLIERPKSLSVVTGLTYLFMLMGVVMLPSIVKILEAIYLPHDDRKLVLTVRGPEIDKEALTVGPQSLAVGDQGQPYSDSLVIRSGAPPYNWQPISSGWAKGMILNPNTGEITLTPKNRYDYFGEFKVTDAKGHSAKGMFAIVVKPSMPPKGNWPKIETLVAPPAVSGAPYEFDMRAVGGVQPYRWEVLKGKLPGGLKFDAHTGRIQGTPTESGQFLVTIRVIDNVYAASQDIYPWIIPFLVTAVCLLGYWNMRRWGVVLYAPLIVAQGVLAAIGVVPVATAALVLQAILWCVGAVNLGKMD